MNAIDRTTSDKQTSRTFQGFFKDKLLFKDYDSINNSAFFNPLLNTLWAKTRHGVNYDFYFFSHAWSHYFIPLSAAKSKFCKMTGYDLQLHLRYRNNIQNKETEVRYCSCSEFQGFFKT